MADDEECPECELAVLGGMALGICRSLKKKELDCEKMAEEFIEGKITIDEIVKKVRPHVKGQDAENLNEIENLVRETL